MTRIDSNQYLQAYNLKLVHVFGGNIEYLFAKYHERVYIVDDDNGKVVKYWQMEDLKYWDQNGQSLYGEVGEQLCGEVQ